MENFPIVTATTTITETVTPIKNDNIMAGKAHIRLNIGSNEIAIPTSFSAYNLTSIGFQSVHHEYPFKTTTTTKIVMPSANDKAMASKTRVRFTIESKERPASAAHSAYDLASIAVCSVRHEYPSITHSTATTEITTTPAKDTAHVRFVIEAKGVPDQAAHAHAHAHSAYDLTSPGFQSVRNEYPAIAPAENDDNEVMTKKAHVRFTINTKEFPSPAARSAYDTTSRYSQSVRREYPATRLVRFESEGLEYNVTVGVEEKKWYTPCYAKSSWLAPSS
ncbi:hypothetical protein ASPCAL05932 [Aspergillus calidoustus]|uniref:Uncharacterized protein n=1 Tax=Aspergillus calidoustus TaxID=454130 RepID=A0A0U5G101_ASPCI|nr:hypothetical protein ASPCAL05932 [Aspergillus calidoustus]